MFDRILLSYLSRIHNTSPPPPINDTGQTYTVYYRNQFSTQYKTDERILRNIISINTECINPADTLKLVIYYPRHTTSNIIIIYHDFLPTPRRGSHVKSDKTHTQSSRYTP